MESVIGERKRKEKMEREEEQEMKRKANRYNLVISVLSSFTSLPPSKTSQKPQVTTFCFIETEYYYILLHCQDQLLTQTLFQNEFQIFVCLFVFAETSVLSS